VPRKLPTTKRTCLRCNKSFCSTGPGHRICPNCDKDPSVDKTRRYGDTYKHLRSEGLDTPVPYIDPKGFIKCS
jgi:hypothetical protein